MGRIEMEVCLRSTHLGRHSLWDTLLLLYIHYILIKRH